MLKILKRIKSIVSLLGEFWAFMKMQKKWWLAPLILILVLMGMLIILTEGSALAPFIYALF
jgi:type IV secretory pathway TrbL component